MKANILKLFLAIGLISLFGIQSCKKDDPKPTEVAQNQLIGDGNKTWKIQSVAVDGIDQTALFAAMTIKFSSTGYTTSGGGVVWPTPGTWNFVDDTATGFFRGDGIQVQLIVSETSLKLSLPWTLATFGGGRASSIAGAHVFTFGL